MVHNEPMGFFKEGEKVWVQLSDGSQRAGVYVGEAETATWFGGEPQAYVVFPDTKEGAEVPTELITPREEKG